MALTEMVPANQGSAPEALVNPWISLQPLGFIKLQPPSGYAAPGQQTLGRVLCFELVARSHFGALVQGKATGKTERFPFWRVDTEAKALRLPQLPSSRHEPSEHLEAQSKQPEMSNRSQGWFHLLQIQIYDERCSGESRQNPTFFSGDPRNGYQMICRAIRRPWRKKWWPPPTPRDVLPWHTPRMSIQQT